MKKIKSRIDGATFKISGMSTEFNSLKGHLYLGDIQTPQEQLFMICP